ncbi:hypothetical protein RHGRI_032133 [Rhododendron griersonianum]|uniref:NB-ARC domain-containing protein n=1 Tax=Rhododendron griersonianum TaxID=479676 RepID=A0AAV6IBD2_9ERIC|nr:hypothetical protein RHGRI_032133 [Rhododendron griersonianum]
MVVMVAGTAGEGEEAERRGGGGEVFRRWCGGGEEPRGRGVWWVVSVGGGRLVVARGGDGGEQRRWQEGGDDLGGLPLRVLSFLMADPFATIGAVTGVVGATAGLVQAVSEAKQAFWDTPKVTLSDNPEEICDNLNEAVQVLSSVRKDFEIEVEKNKTRVPSRTYMEWVHRVMEIEDRAKDLIAQYNNQGEEETSIWSIFSYPDFREEMKLMHEKVINLLRESNEIKDKMLVDRAPESIVKRKGPDIKKYETLRKPLEKILDWLKRYEVNVIGIHGTVGIGKTTVMLNLNNHDQVAKMFDLVIWLTISKEGGNENLKRKHLQRTIAQRLKLTMARTSNVTEVAQRIFTELEGKKFLLLLDDVKEYLNLNEIGIPFSNNGSKIVLTTRLREVCNSMVDKAVKLAYLSPDEAWKMFQNVLGSKKLIEDLRIGPLAWRVCRECCGLPLLIEKVANTFKLKNTESLWSDGLDSWRMWPSQECEGIKEMYELLRFCFNELGDDRYKICFLYGALYPEDSEINIDSLLECWEAEDLLGNGNDARKVRVMIGDLVLSHLKNVSLLEEGKSDYHVTMHKFIRRVALYISEGYPECKHLVETNKELREPPDEESWREKKRISLGDNELDRLPDCPDCNMLSTLFLQKNLGLENIPPAFFEHMINLRVLDLSHTGITSLPSSLSIMIGLKVLDLSNCEQLVELPSHIGELVHLESLDIHGSGITNIPPNIDKLIFLKRLWVSFGNGNDTQDLSFNYDMISKLSRLEELVIDVKSPQQLTDEVVENIMKEVATLRKFKRLRVCFPNMIVDVIEVAPMTVRICVPDARILLSYIRRNWWKVVRRIGPFRFFIGCQNSEQNPNFVIYKRYVKYCNGVGSNNPILEVLAEAEGFDLVNHKDIKQLSDFGTTNMNKIRGCLVESCDTIETIMDTVGSELLPNLEQLFVRNLPMLKSIWKELGPLQPGTLTKLTTLVLSGCRILVEVFPPGAIQLLRGIRHLKIEKCDEVEDIIPEADVVGNLLVLPKLEELILLDMAKLSSICAAGSLEWPSLEKLEIFGCPGLGKLPFNKGDVANLERIEADEEWWGALQWQNQEDKEGLQKLCIFSQPPSLVTLFPSATPLASVQLQTTTSDYPFGDFPTSSTAFDDPPMTPSSHLMPPP